MKRNDVLSTFNEISDNDLSLCIAYVCWIVCFYTFVDSVALKHYSSAPSKSANISSGKVNDTSIFRKQH